jgi:hypothetical protein
VNGNEFKRRMRTSREEENQARTQELAKRTVLGPLSHFYANLLPKFRSRMTGDPESVTVISLDGKEKVSISCYPGGCQVIFHFVWEAVRAAKDPAKSWDLTWIGCRQLRPSIAVMKLREEWSHRFDVSMRKRA